MKNNDFKINNRVILSHGGDKKAKVIGLDKKKIFLETTINGETLEIHAMYTDIKPILVTPKRLEKLGFIYDPNHNRAVLEDKNLGLLCIYMDDLTVCISDSAKGLDNGDCAFCTGAKAKYVHQIQNLYYSLAGRELVQ